MVLMIRSGTAGGFMQKWEPVGIVGGICILKQRIRPKGGPTERRDGASETAHPSQILWEGTAASDPSAPLVEGYSRMGKGLRPLSGEESIFG